MRIAFARIIRRALWGALLASALQSCGGGGGSAGSGSTPSQNNATQTIGSVTVPVVNAAEINLTVKGVDANANGVRDEIEQDLAVRFGASVAEYSAITKFAAKLQTTFSLSTPTQAQASAAMISELQSYDCLEAVLGQDKAMALAGELDARTYNTVARRLAREAVLQSIGAVELPSSTGGAC